VPFRIMVREFVEELQDDLLRISWLFSRLEGL
jgi:hypothetical protein